ncbi:MAG: hypothetical protein U5L95_01995 [Candidatus Saccharibacteria bacterium]|nr:hypothetical protein [Candidatus Saccharibacteria bacterium]
MRRLAAILIVLFSFASIGLFSGDVVSAQVLNPACEGVDPLPPACSETDNDPFRGGSLLSDVVRLFSYALGVIVVIMVIIAGIKFATSGGDASSVKSARDTLLYAVLALAIAAIAQLILIFVIDKV